MKNEENVKKHFNLISDLYIYYFILTYILSIKVSDMDFNLFHFENGINDLIDLNYYKNIFYSENFIEYIKIFASMFIFNIPFFSIFVFIILILPFNLLKKIFSILLASFLYLTFVYIDLYYKSFTHLPPYGFIYPFSKELNINFDLALYIIKNNFDIYDYIFFIYYLLVVICLFFKRKVSNNIKPIKFLLFQIIALFICSHYFIVNNNNYSPIDRNKKRILDDLNYKVLIKESGIYYYYFQGIIKNILKTKINKEDFLIENENNNEEYRGFLKDRDIIFLELDSFSPMLFDLGLAPFLKSLTEKSLYFKNVYNVYQQDDYDSIYTLNTGYLPYPYSATYKTFENLENNLYDMLNINNYDVFLIGKGFKDNTEYINYKDFIFNITDKYNIIRDSELFKEVIDILKEKKDISCILKLQALFTLILLKIFKIKKKITEKK